MHWCEINISLYRYVTYHRQEAAGIQMLFRIGVDFQMVLDCPGRPVCWLYDIMPDCVMGCDVMWCEMELNGTKIRAQNKIDMMDVHGYVESMMRAYR